MVEAASSSAGRERFGSRMGFVMAAVGSAVGLGNMWRFSYVTAQGGGAAFVIMYLAMTFLIGVPMMLTEFAVGRRARMGAIGAMREAGGVAWVPAGFMFVITASLILSYLSVITGWTIRYAIDAAVVGFSPDPGARYEQVATGVPAIGFHLAAMAATTAIVIAGVRKGIERVSFVLMPVLFLLLVGLAVWAATLPGARDGYDFYLRPSLGAVANLSVLQQAASQAFFSLSVGMGIMLTYASYLAPEENMSREAVIISLADFTVAFVAGLVVFPVIFALGLSEQIDESTMGTLFISVPGAFHAMGGIGRLVGFAFFLTLLVAALTSAVSLLEVPTAALMDAWKVSRRTATLVAGAVIALLGIPAAVSQNALALVDKLAGELLVVAGVLAMALMVGWVMRHPEDELMVGASRRFRGVVRLAMFMVRYIIPPFIALMLWVSIRDVFGMVGR